MSDHDHEEYGSGYMDVNLNTTDNFNTNKTQVFTDGSNKKLSMFPPIKGQIIPNKVTPTQSDDMHRSVSPYQMLNTVDKLGTIGESENSSYNSKSELMTHGHSEILGA